MLTVKAIRPSPSSLIFLSLQLHILFRSLRSRGLANLPGRGRKRKIDDKLKKRIIRMVTKEPRTTSNEIRGELQGQGISVSDRTIRRCLSQSRPRRTPLLVESKSYKSDTGICQNAY